MPNFAIIKPDGTVNHITDTLAQAEFEAEQLNMVLAPVPDEISVLDALTRGVYVGNILMLRDNVTPVFKAPTIENVRTQRNYLLLMCDWTQLPDVPQATQTAWRPYRQALRDFPQQAAPLIADWPIAP
jgi:hypothetical protein